MHLYDRYENYFNFCTIGKPLKKVYQVISLYLRNIIRKIMIVIGILLWCIIYCYCFMR